MRDYGSIVNSIPEKKEVFDEIKRSIRRFYKKVCAPRDCRCVRDNGIDGYVLLITLPEWVQNKQDAIYYMVQNEVMECRPSQYDCTGQHFTNWYKVFCRRGRWMAYHSIRVDV